MIHSSYMWVNCRHLIRREIESSIMHNAEQVIINVKIGNNIRSIHVEVMLFSLLNIFPFYSNVVVSIRCRLCMIESQSMEKFMNYCTCIKTSRSGQIQFLRTILESFLVSNLRRTSTVGLCKDFSISMNSLRFHRCIT